MNLRQVKLDRAPRTGLRRTPGGPEGYGSLAHTFPGGDGGAAEARRRAGPGLGAGGGGAPHTVPAAAAET
jgi:hypothetical protein